MRLSAWTISAIAACVLPLGCSKDGVDDDVAGDETNDGGDEATPWQPGPARGDIALTSVSLNQGVEVAIAVDGEWVGPEARNTYVVSDRDTLIRAYWEIPEDWVPRDITARLELTYDDGTKVTLDDTKTIDGPSYPGDLDRAFYWAVVAEDFPPGLQFHISLLEASEAGDEQRESTTITEAPIGGPQLIGVQSEPVEMKVHVFPVVYNNGSGCNTDSSTITEEEEQTFIDYLHEQKPVQEIKWVFHRDTPIQWNTALNSLADLWPSLQQLRTDNAAAPNDFYYALVNVCGGGIGDAAGIAAGIVPPTKDSAYQRVATGVWIPNNKYSYEVLVHELGHLQGRQHTFCQGGGAAGTDPAYPYDNGIIAVWGFGIRLFRLHSPTGTFDYMSYCQPIWPSDWTWSKTYTHIRTLTSWDYEDAPANPEPEGEVLMGVVTKDGHETWWTAKGRREDEYFASAQTITVDYGDAQLDLPAAVEVLEDQSQMITIQLPRPGVTFENATRWDSQGAAHPIYVQRDVVSGK